MSRKQIESKKSEILFPEKTKHIKLNQHILK